MITNKITDEDIKFFDDFLYAQNNPNSSGHWNFANHLLKLVKAVKEIQSQENVKN